MCTTQPSYTPFPDKYTPLPEIRFRYTATAPRTLQRRRGAKNVYRKFRNRLSPKMLRECRPPLFEFHGWRRRLLKPKFIPRLKSGKRKRSKMKQTKPTVQEDTPPIANVEEMSDVTPPNEEEEHLESPKSPNSAATNAGNAAKTGMSNDLAANAANAATEDFASVPPPFRSVSNPRSDYLIAEQPIVSSLGSVFVHMYPYCTIGGDFQARMRGAQTFDEMKTLADSIKGPLRNLVSPATRGEDQRVAKPS